MVNCFVFFFAVFVSFQKNQPVQYLFTSHQCQLKGQHFIGQLARRNNKILIQVCVSFHLHSIAVFSLQHNSVNELSSEIPKWHCYSKKKKKKNETKCFWKGGVCFPILFDNGHCVSVFKYWRANVYHKTMKSRNSMTEPCVL